MTKTGPRGLTLSLQKQNQIREYFLANKSAYLTSQETGISYRTVKKYYAIFTEELPESPSPVTDKPTQAKNARPAYLKVGVIPTAQEHADYQTGTFQKYDPEVIRTHIPQYNVVPYTSPRAQERRPLSAAELNPRTKNKKRLFPKFFMNPYQDLDYIVLQDIYANSVAGRIMDRILELVFSRGIKPVLKLRNPEDFGDEAAQQKEIEKDQKIIDNLLLIDEAVSDPDDEIDPFLDSDIQTKFIALAKNSMVYGRSMIIKEFTKPIKLGDGNVIRGVPNVLKVINPRDMGIVEIDQESWKLESVQIRFTSQNIVPLEMIYLEHGSNNPVYNGLHYGYSAMQSMIGASRSLKQMIEVDFPTITKHLWSGSGSIVVKPEGTTEQEKAEELSTILQNYREGRWNGMMIDPENIQITTHDLNPKIADLVQLADFLIRHNIAQTGMPQAIFAQEKDSNRATLIGKLRLFMDGPAATLQEWITNAIGKQWYMPNFRAIYPRDSKLYKKYRVEAAFEPLKLESFQDNVDAVMKLNREVPLTAEAIGELLNIDEFADKVDPDLPRGTGKGISLTDGEGNPFNMENA